MTKIMAPLPRLPVRPGCITLTYNDRRELVHSTRKKGAQTTQNDYQTDQNYNRTQRNNDSFVSNAADQLLQAGANALTYNAAGQATGVANKSFTFAYNDQVKTVQGDGVNAEYLYDGNGQRVRKTVNGVVSKFLWSGGEISKEYAADDTVRNDYLLGAGREAIKNGGSWKFYLTDIQGSTLALTDGHGQITDRYEYSDFGETTHLSGVSTNPFLYTGQELDSETGLYHLRARHYAPGLGKFLSRDPIGYAAGTNCYSYCGGDPINLIDTLGLTALTVTLLRPALGIYDRGPFEGMPNVAVQGQITNYNPGTILPWVKSNDRFRNVKVVIALRGKKKGSCIEEILGSKEYYYDTLEGVDNHVSWIARYDPSPLNY